MVLQTFARSHLLCVDAPGMGGSEGVFGRMVLRMCTGRAGLLIVEGEGRGGGMLRGWGAIV